MIPSKREILTVAFRMIWKQWTYEYHLMSTNRAFISKLFYKLITKNNQWLIINFIYVYLLKIAWSLVLSIHFFNDFSIKLTISKWRIKWKTRKTFWQIEKWILIVVWNSNLTTRALPLYKEKKWTSFGLRLNFGVFGVGLLSFFTLEPFPYIFS